MSRRRVLSLYRFLAVSAALWTVSFPCPSSAAQRAVPPIQTTVISEVDREAADVPADSARVTGVSIEAQPLDGVGARAAAVLLSDQRGGEVDGALTWTSSGVVAESGHIAIQVYIEVAGGDLLEGTRVYPVPIDIYGYVTNPDGGLTSYISQVLFVRDSDQAQRIQETGIKFVFELEVPRGAHSFRVLVVNRPKGRFFLDGCVLGLPVADPARGFLLPPLVAEPADNWTIGFQNGLRPAALLQGLPGMTAWPSAAPLWRLGEPLGIVLGGSELSATARVVGRLVDSSGQTVLDTEIEIGPVVTERNGLFFYRASVAPLDVGIGEYSLVVVVSGADGDQMVSPSLPVLIHDQDSILAWTDPAAPREPRFEPSSLSTRGTRSEGAAEDDPEPPEPEPQSTEGDDIVFDCPDDDETLPLEPIDVIPLRGVGARGAALMFSGQSGGEVDGAVIWTSDGSRGGADEISVQFMVEVDGRSLIAGSPHPRIPIEVYGYLLDENGKVAGTQAEGILLDQCRRVQMIQETGLKFVGDVDVAPGLYSFRVLVRNRLTGRFFLARRDLDLRFDDTQQMVLLPPLIEEPPDRWVIAGRSGSESESVSDEITGIPSWPSARPVWRADQALEMVVGCSELKEGREISARLYDRLGNPVLDPDVDVNEEISSEGGLTFYSVSVAAPDVPVGEYRFAVILNDADSGQTVSQSLSTIIHDGATELVWNDPAAPRAARLPSAPSLTSQPTSEDLNIETMRAAYMEILRMWSNGEVVEARRKLAALEAPLESNESDRSWRQLITVERLTALTLARSRPDSAMAVALLHRDMHGWYLSRRETILAQHSWRMASTIARLAPSIDGWSRSDAFSECLLLDLASRLARSGDRNSARQLLETAADVAPGSAPALLGLGALSERSGYPDEAVEEFRTLYKKHPEHAEGRLRLAVNRARVGDEKGAEELFRGLLEPSSPLWIRTVAYQELGSLLLDEGRIDDAERLLREGVAQIPGNQRLQILLAHSIDQARKPKEAGVVIDRLDMRVSQQNTSPRYRYSAWPDLDSDRVRLTLDEGRVAGLEALREALP